MKKVKLSEYLRFVFLNKPVRVYVRAQSLDLIPIELSLLKSKIAANGNNFNQAVKRLLTLDKISVIKFWAEQNEKQDLIHAINRRDQ